MPLSDDDKKKYKDLYVQSAKPYIADLQKIAALQDTDAATTEVIHRAAHSMGSQSLMMDYTSIGTLSRLIERIFKAKVDENYVISPETKEVLMKAVGRMDESVQKIADEGQEIDLNQEIEALKTTSNMTVEV